MQYFPLFMNLRDRPILVVGGGEVACRKVDSLIRAGANVSIVSPQIDQYLQRLVERNECHWIQNFYSKKYLIKNTFKCGPQRIILNLITEFMMMRKRWGFWLTSSMISLIVTLLHLQ